jgi:integrase
MINESHTFLPLINEVGGPQNTCNIQSIIGQNILNTLPEVSEIMEELKSRLIYIKGPEVPIFLDPKTATLTDVGIHAHIRQNLGLTTIEKHIRYLKFMELHPCPVLFNNLTPESFIRHMDYRRYVEKPPATSDALNHEKKALLMCLRAFRQYTDDWKEYVKTPRKQQSESHRDVVVPVPRIVNKLYHAEFSTDEYENVLLQSIVFLGFNFGPRPPSEICNLDIDDLIIYDDGNGYIVLTEDKKHGISRRVRPWDTVVLSSKVYRTPKNYRDTWRSMVYDEDKSGSALFLQPNGRRITGGYLRSHIAPIFKEISQDPKMIMYDMRHTFGTYMYAQTKDIYKVAKRLGHVKTQNVDHYIYISDEIEQQVNEKRRSLFHQALRQSHKSDGGKFGEKGDTCIKHPLVSPNPSEKDEWACPNLNRSL